MRLDDTQYLQNHRTQRPATLTSDVFTPRIVDSASWTTQGLPDSQIWGDPSSSDEVNIDWIYDSDTLRLSELKADKNTGTQQLQRLVYSYDDNSNIESILDYKNSNQYQCFGYDDLNRLETAFTGDDCSGADSTGEGTFDVSFSYDDLGNLSVSGASYSYGGGSAGPHAADSGNGWSFTYDGNGNQITRTDPNSELDTLTYDVNNRLVNYESDTNGTPIDTYFVYDAAGSRVAVIDDGDAVHHIGGVHVHDVDAGTEENTYTFGGLTVGLNDDGTRHHVISDHLGSVTATIEYGAAANEGYIKRRRYHPYGDERGTVEATAGARSYTGQVDDTNSTGLLFYNARYYDPVLRRFISPDTIIPNPTSALGWNRYGYVNNNPINSNDPSGHCAEDPECVYDGIGFDWEGSGGGDEANVVIGTTTITLALATELGEFVHKVRVQEIGRGDYLRFEVYDDATDKLVHVSRTEPTFMERVSLRDMATSKSRWTDLAPDWLKKNLDAGAARWLKKVVGPAGVAIDIVQVTGLAMEVQHSYGDALDEGYSRTDSFRIAIGKYEKQIGETIGSLSFGWYGAVVGVATCGPVCAAAGLAVGTVGGYFFGGYIAEPN